MKRRFSLTIAGLSLIVTACLGSLIIAGQTVPPNKYAGTWAGTWTGGSSGKFEMTIIADAAGKLTASMVTTPDGGDGASFQSKSIEATDSIIKLKFDDSMGNVEVSLEGAIDSGTLKGTYLVRDKTQNNEIEKGTWTLTKK